MSKPSSTVPLHVGSCRLASAPNSQVIVAHGSSIPATVVQAFTNTTITQSLTQPVSTLKGEMKELQDKIAVLNLLFQCKQTAVKIIETKENSSTKETDPVPIIDKQTSFLNKLYVKVEAAPDENFKDLMVIDDKLIKSKLEHVGLKFSNNPTIYIDIYRNNRLSKLIDDIKNVAKANGSCSVIKKLLSDALCDMYCGFDIWRVK